MAVIEGIIASVRMDAAHSVVTVYPIETLPKRRIAPEGAVELLLRREPWQTEQSHQDHLDYMVGRPGFIEYAGDGAPFIELIRNH